MKSTAQVRSAPNPAIFITILAFFAGFVLVSAPASADELSAQDIMDRSLETHSFGFQSGHAQMTLTVYDRAGEQRTRKLDVKSRRTAAKEGEEKDAATRTLVTLTHPAEVRGQAFLFVENKTGDDDVWMYVPAFAVTRRIEGSQKRGAFLGTHFTYADLETRDIKDATYKRLKDEKIGDIEVYVIEARPKKKGDSDYSKTVAYIRKSDFMPLRVRFFGKDNKVEKTMFMEKLDQTPSGRTFVRQMMLRSERGGYTRILIDAIDDQAEIPEALFSREQLGK